MAKKPQAGRTKTRLAAALGETEAAAIYEAMLLDTLETCGQVDAALLISYAPHTHEAAGYFRRIAPSAALTAQPETGFGGRLSSAMQAAFDREFEQVAVVGSDIPQIARASIEQAFDALEGHDAALGPTRDGGYYLLALSAAQPRLFTGIEWSSGRELAQSVDRAAALGLRLAMVEEAFDIDEVEDLISLRELIAADGSAVCPRTAAALSRMDERVPTGVDAFAP